MKKVRIFLAAAALAASTLFVSATPASASSASCAGEPNACEIVCAIGLGSKYTRDLFAWCYIT